jgi:FlaA1/EpsC-like NDP-sugar epimerase
MGRGGEIFLLDMGDPVKIVRLAEEMIRLSGRVPYEDIEIVFTGLRPGEKLYEELLIAGEGVKATRHEKIRILEAASFSSDLLKEETEQLLKATRAMDADQVIAILKRLVPEFHDPSQQGAQGMDMDAGQDKKLSSFNIVVKKVPEE